MTTWTFTAATAALLWLIWDLPDANLGWTGSLYLLSTTLTALITLIIVQAVT